MFQNNRKYIVIVILLLVSFYSSAHLIHSKKLLVSQDTIRFHNFGFGNYLKDTKTTLTEPLRWKSKEWLSVGMYSGLSVAIYYGLDQRMKKFIQSEKNQTKFLNGSSFVFEKFGNKNIYLFTIPSVYLFGILTENHRVKRLSAIALETFILTGLVTQTTKFLGGRMRPSTEEPFDTWTGISMATTERRSFFSGHTSVVFCMATVFAKEFEDIKYIPLLSYSIASITAISRVYDNAHWLSDVFVGAVIGHSVAKVVIRENRSRNIAFTPFYSANGISGISLCYKF